MTTVADVMPHVSRALKRGDRRDARRELERVLDRRTARLAMIALTADPQQSGFARRDTFLTPAQWACIWNAACGLTIPEAARRFQRTPDTIASHRKAALARLRVATVAGAVAECYRRGLFDRDEPLVPVDW